MSSAIARLNAFSYRLTGCRPSNRCPLPKVIKSGEQSDCPLSRRHVGGLVLKEALSHRLRARRRRPLAPKRGLTTASTSNTENDRRAPLGSGFGFCGARFRSVLPVCIWYALGSNRELVLFARLLRGCAKRRPTHDQGADRRKIHRHAGWDLAHKDRASYIREGLQEKLLPDGYVVSMNSVTPPSRTANAGISPGLKGKAQGCAHAIRSGGIHRGANRGDQFHSRRQRPRGHRARTADAEGSAGWTAPAAPHGSSGNHPATS